MVRVNVFTGSEVKFSLITLNAHLSIVSNEITLSKKE